MNHIQEILKSSKKPKEKVEIITKDILTDNKLVKDLFECFNSGTDAEKGNCADVFKHVSAAKPTLFKPFIQELIDNINNKLPRITWGTQEAIGNISAKFPKEIEKAVPNLLKNTANNSTVIKWCAAYALTEIAKNNSSMRKELIPKFDEIIKKENNNGVKNVYVKALKAMI